MTTPPLYKISLDLGNEKFAGTGESILEALQNLPTPVKIVAKSNLTLSKGKKKLEQVLMPVKAKRLFYPNSQYVIAKQLDRLFK